MSSDFVDLYYLINIKLILALVVISIFIVNVILSKIYQNTQCNNRSVCVIVLGDLGRSPRMNYHCLSFVKAGYSVSFVGYKESKLIEQVEQNEKIKIVPIRTFPECLSIGPRLIRYAFKMVFLSLTLMLSLIRLKPIPKYVIVQNPPSIPTLALVYLYSLFTDSKLIIDWHNYGHTILALDNGPNNILVKICKKVEIFFGRRSDFNLCVTHAMRDDLASYNIKALTMYDKPHESFKPLNVEEKHSFFQKLHQKYDLKEFADPSNNDNTAFTQVNGNITTLKQSRPVLLVSSSSWTADEDFHILVDALQSYQEKITKNQTKLPNVICALTGKGPLKDYYKKLFESKNFQNVKILFLWLDPQDYPLLLGCADLGICLHMSSSNLDLPMKVVDMFGTTLPVCAIKFKCISELVQEEKFGKLFENSDQLSAQLEELLPESFKENSKLNYYRRNLIEFQNRRWDIEWNSVMSSII